MPQTGSGSREEPKSGQASSATQKEKKGLEQKAHLGTLEAQDSASVSIGQGIGNPDSNWDLKVTEAKASKNSVVHGVSAGDKGNTTAGGRTTGGTSKESNKGI